MGTMVRVKIQNETNSGHRRGFSKLVQSVDLQQKNGYAFVGPFINDGQETDVEVGAVVVQKHPEGSAKRGWESGHCYTVGKDGQLHETDGKSYDWHKDFLSFRDHVAAVVAKQQAGGVAAQIGPHAIAADAIQEGGEDGRAELVRSVGTGTPVPPEVRRAAALDEIRRLMGAHGLTPADL